MTATVTEDTSAARITGDLASSEVPAPILRVEGLSRVHGRGEDAVTALEGMDLTVERGEFVCVLGASGCGKSTLLNLLAGLDRAARGSIAVDGSVGLMFQESALFPWLTVAGNVAIALELRGVPRRRRQAIVEDLLTSVHLTGFGGRRPHELSGGMRQRVALARALAQDVDVLAMDEPFAALDAMTRDLLHDQLERQWRERDLTIVFVTHNVREAVRLADRVILLSSRPGRVLEEYAIDLPRPRRTDSATVAGLAATITNRLKEEVRRHAGDPTT